MAKNMDGEEENKRERGQRVVVAWRVCVCGGRGGEEGSAEGYRMGKRGRGSIVALSYVAVTTRALKQPGIMVSGVEVIMTPREGFRSSFCQSSAITGSFSMLLVMLLFYFLCFLSFLSLVGDGLWLFSGVSVWVCG